MKKLFLIILLISNITFSQQTNFRVENNTIFWSINNDKINFEALNKHPKITFTEEKKGFFQNAKSKCPGSSIFMREEFNFDFRISNENNTIKIEVYNIRFKNSIQTNLYGVSTSNSDAPFENYALKNDNTLRTNNTFKKNFECLHSFFKEVFNQ